MTLPLQLWTSGVFFARAQALLDDEWITHDLDPAPGAAHRAGAQCGVVTGTSVYLPPPPGGRGALAYTKLKLHTLYLESHI